LEGRALILTGTCGSGKTTVAELLASREGWVRVSEDDVWHEEFGRDRATFGSSEHRRRRRQVHDRVFASVLGAVALGKAVVIDATVHESPPESFREYRAFFGRNNIAWRICVLHPRLEVAIARDSARRSWNVGPERVASLYAKFTGAIFPPDSFLDTSLDTPEDTMGRIIASGA
jgi:predicted kinase